MTSSADRTASCKFKRGIIKAKLTNFEKLLDSITVETDIETLDLETRLKEKHLPLQEEFEKYQNELETLFAGNAEELASNEEERSNFENRFYLISGRVKTLVKRGRFIPPSVASRSDSEPVVNPSTSNNSNSENSTHGSGDTLRINSSNYSDNSSANNAQNSQSNHIAPRGKLPDLKIPTFSGSFDTWLGFYDAFNSMIHNDKDIPIIQKFLYLKGCVTGDAANVISSLETTSDNYKVAWELLTGRYHNKKFIIDSHVKALFELPSVSKEFSIRAFYDSVQKHVRALRALSVEVDKWDAILNHLIKSKLNNYTIEKWEESICDTENPTLLHMLNFLERRSQIEETRAATNQASFPKNSHSKNGFHTRQNPRHPFTGVATSTAPNSNDLQSKPVFKISCHICKGEHGVYSCSKFLSLSPKDRYEAARKASLCVNCLRGNHHPANCFSSGCRKCGKRHNSLLHFNQQGSDTRSHSNNLAQNQSEQANQSSQAPSTPVANYQLTIPSEVVLATAVVDIIDQHGKTHACRIMLDSGSQPHVITDEFAKKIGLKKVAVNIPLQAVDNLATSIKYTAAATIKSRYNNVQHHLSLFVVTEIGNTMPTLPIDRSSFEMPQDLFLADPGFYNPAEVDMILGAQYFYHFLRPGQIQIKNHPAVLQETELGWVVAGCFHQSLAKHAKVYCNFTRFSDLSLLWELDSSPAASMRSMEEEICESHYVKHTKRDESGRYTVHLTFNKNKIKIGESRQAAFNRFHSLEGKFVKNPTLKTQYFECMQGYINENHMTLLENEESSDRGFFLPHHAVIKTSSLTTKTRVVFDGSCKSSSGVSLNDALMVGPTIQDDLFSTFTRFRTFLFALTGDIEQMYRQIQLAEEDRLFHKILWRETPNDLIKVYTLNTVTFGTASAPFLAIRTLHQLADDERENYPAAAAILKRDFYVDDLLTGANTYQEALSLRNDLIEILHKGGFNLRKWGSNDPRLTTEFKNDLPDSHMSLDPTETIKTLGLFWNPSADSIIYTVNLTESNTQLTKRTIFSQIAKLFDPLGLLGPVIVSAKIIIQGLWKAKLSWDEPVPTNLQQIWVNYRDQLALLNHLEFKRCITVPNQTEVQLHGFSDASEKAYGACIYLRSTDIQGKHHTSLVCSKSRIAPLKSTTIPKLELCAALLLAKLYTTTIQSLKIQVDKLQLWSDSTLTLQWINSPSYTLTTFEANRVAEIQTLTDPTNWRHVPTRDNPADLISRGQTPREFLDNKFWQHGPEWLCQTEDTWPELQFHTGEDPGKRKKLGMQSLSLTISKKWNLLEKYSSIRTLNNVLAYVLRFIHNLKNKEKLRGPLSDAELHASHQMVLKLTQMSAFSKEIHSLSKGENVNHKSSLLSLNPFLDKGVIKVGGRLSNAKIPENQKHPIVLPRNHHITRLIIREEHSRKLHAGTQATLYGVRETYWPIDGKNVTRHVIRQCITCFKAKPRGINCIMGNLPENRLVPARPFLNVGIDYCGPFYIKEKRFRNRTRVKAYVSIFICFATKAVHLELVSDLTTEAFLGCLKRFFARRGKSKNIYSDNATNFLGARNELRALYDYVQSAERNPAVQNFLANENITWHFIPPRSPHFGGLWEAAVKSFKHHLLRNVGNTLLTQEQFETYVIEIEAILNSRPLSPLSSDPNDLLPLTPGHFLIGSSLTSFPQEDLRDIPEGRLSAWQHVQFMRHHFWSRWHREYLSQMITRSKWQSATPQDSIKIGTLVILKEDNLPPMSWKLGRIVDLYPGEDKLIRVVSVHTSTGTYKRSLTRLCPLPMSSSSDF